MAITALIPAERHGTARAAPCTWHFSGGPWGRAQLGHLLSLASRQCLPVPCPQQAAACTHLSAHTKARFALLKETQIAYWVCVDENIDFVLSGKSPIKKI